MTDFDYEKFRREQIEAEEKRRELQILRRALVQSALGNRSLRAEETASRRYLGFEVLNGRELSEPVLLTKDQWIAFRNEVDTFYTREEEK